MNLNIEAAFKRDWDIQVFREIHLNLAEPIKTISLKINIIFTLTRKVDWWVKVTKISSAPYLSHTLDLHPTQDAGSSPPEKTWNMFQDPKKTNKSPWKISIVPGKYHQKYCIFQPAICWLIPEGKSSFLWPLHPRVRGVGAPTHTFPGSAKERFSGSNFIRQARTMLPWDGMGASQLGIRG